MRTMFLLVPASPINEAQADNRGLETSISGLFLRIMYMSIYMSIYCLANSFLTKKFCSELMLINKFLQAHISSRYTKTEKYFLKRNERSFV